MTCELISVGTDLLLGSVVNTNAAYLAASLAALGMPCYYQTTVGDNEERLSDALRTGLSRSDVLIVTGGMGVTPDDITKKTAADVLGLNLIADQAVLNRLSDYYGERGLELTANIRELADIPKGALVLENPNGITLGMILQKDQKHIILLPGREGEMVPMFRENVVPYLSRLSEGAICSKVVKLCGITESEAIEKIGDLLEMTNPSVASYAMIGEVHLRVTASAEDEKEAKKLIKPVVRDLKERFDTKIYSSEEGVSLEQAVVDLLVANELTVSTIESCTGGKIAARLINVAGVSDVFKSGYVTYSNKAKKKLAGVKRSTLEKYGAVSEQTAKEMAVGIAAFSRADVTVSVTGIAGPGGGSKEKPVGLVYMACCVCGTTVVKEFHFTGNREKIRDASTAAALTLMRQCILEYYSKKTFGH